MTAEVSCDQIVKGLSTLVLQSPACLMIHASLSRFGHVKGGAETIVTALRTIAGAGGAVIVPSFRDSIRSDHYALRKCETVCPQSTCPSDESGFTGIIGETVRRQADSIRSCHPTHSWVGIGDDAKYLLEGHRQSLTPCGRESPFFRLLERDGLILLLGVGINSLTNIHCIEDAQNLPYLSAVDPQRRHATYTTSGRRIQYTYPEYLHHTLEECNLIQSTVIGNAVCLCLRARDVASFLWVVTEDDPWCLVLRPLGHVYDPEADAKTKTQRMIEVWKNAPDWNAWQSLLIASRGVSVPVLFSIAKKPQENCPAYRGFIRGFHRCAANDIPPWERFEDYSIDEPGVATCDTCNWH